MAKQLWFLSPTTSFPSAHRGNNDAKLNGVTSWWNPGKLSEVRGTTVTAATVATVAGATNGVEVVASSLPVEWVSEPLSADFTISGTITFNLYASESTTAANAAINALVEKMDGATGTLTQIVKTARVTELTTSMVAANFTAAPTSTACKRGDRIRVRVFADDAGTMAAALTVSFDYSGATAAADGDSWVQFTENLTFETTAPTGSTYYLTDTVASINPGSATEKVASTTRGSGSVNAVTNTAGGPTSGIQITDSGGGTAIEWYTPALEAVTLGGMAKFNIKGLESNAAANASLRAEIAITAGDGTGAAAWGTACFNNSVKGEINTADTQPYSVWVAGDDTAVSAGQRLRFRLYLEDLANGPLVTGNTVTVSYNGTSAAATGDTYVTLPVTVTEQAGAAFTPKPRMLVRPGVTVLRAGVR